MREQYGVRKVEMFYHKHCNVSKMVWHIFTVAGVDFTTIGNQSHNARVKEPFTQTACQSREAHFRYIKRPHDAGLGIQHSLTETTR